MICDKIATSQLREHQCAMQVRFQPTPRPEACVAARSDDRHCPHHSHAHAWNGSTWRLCLPPNTMGTCACGAKRARSFHRIVQHTLVSLLSVSRCIFFSSRVLRLDFLLLPLCFLLPSPAPLFLEALLVRAHNKLRPVCH